MDVRRLPLCCCRHSLWMFNRESAGWCKLSCLRQCWEIQIRLVWNINTVPLSDWSRYHRRCANFWANSLRWRLIPGSQQRRTQLLSPQGSCFVLRRPSISSYGLLAILGRFRFPIRCCLKASTEASGRRRRRCSSMFVCESWSPLLSPRPLSRCQFTRWAGSCVYLHSCVFSNWCVSVTLLLPILADGWGPLVN